ncbi:hypothetical protein HAX54_001976, partial [Datura stramonium]|nr:hypothetical protein [Datura stramonium]
FYSYLNWDCTSGHLDYLVLRAAHRAKMPVRHASPCTASVYVAQAIAHPPPNHLCGKVPIEEQQQQRAMPLTRTPTSSCQPLTWSAARLHNRPPAFTRCIIHSHKLDSYVRI